MIFGRKRGSMIHSLYKIIKSSKYVESWNSGKNEMKSTKYNAPEKWQGFDLRQGWKLERKSISFQMLELMACKVVGEGEHTKKYNSEVQTEQTVKMVSLRPQTRFSGEWQGEEIRVGVVRWKTLSYEWLC